MSDSIFCQAIFVPKPAKVTHADKINLGLQITLKPHLWQSGSVIKNFFRKKTLPGKPKQI